MTDTERRLQLAHQARRAKEHQLDDIRRALCDAGVIRDDDPYSHADLADVIRQTVAEPHPTSAPRDGVTAPHSAPHNLDDTQEAGGGDEASGGYTAGPETSHYCPPACSEGHTYSGSCGLRSCGPLNDSGRPVNCPALGDPECPCQAQQGPAYNERRQRYARVLRTTPATGHTHKPGQEKWDHHPAPGSEGGHRYTYTCALCRGDIDALTDAVLAVADAEQDDLRARLEERTRQLGEVRTRTTELEARVNGELADAEQRVHELESAAREADRLRRDWATAQTEISRLQDELAELKAGHDPRLRCLIVKAARDRDLYIGWSNTCEMPAGVWTRAEALAYGFPPSRLDRADANGSSDLSCGDGHWDDSGFVAEQRGWLRRDRLADYAQLYLSGREGEAFDLLEPLDGETEVRR